MLRIRRALISVWDKKGVTDFARRLANLNIEIISTGKTARLLKKNGIAVKSVASLTSFPEILSGRVKTLHPKIFGGVLANKKHPLHMEEIKHLDIQPIDMVVVNLYPFPQKVQDKLGWDQMIEYIDIGGPSMLRAAAKNFKNVAAVSGYEQYKPVLEELEKNKGFLTAEILKRLAQDAFYVTKEYDNCIYNYFKGCDVLTWNLEKVSVLRYGENRHQKGELYRLINHHNMGFSQLHGKELSFNNILDLDVAQACVKEFISPAAVIVKHGSLCGVGIDKRLSTAYKKAYLTDPLSSFGGIISLNRKVDRETAAQILKTEFKECIIAPGFSKEALKIFSVKKNLRLVEADPAQKVNTKDVRATLFGYLVQDRNTVTLDRAHLKVATKRKPTARELKDLVFGWKVAKHVKSNAIVAAKNLTVLGIGAGQPSRVGSVKIALRAAAAGAKGAVLASDGFFPKEDAIKLAYRKGIKAIIQPGGSIKDKDLISLCDRLGVAMVFTGIRHFKH